MIAMQYSIPLPPNFAPDMVRQRVEQRRASFDSHAGLVHKSFLYHAKERLYAPFYVWKDVGEARDFLLNELFHGVVETFNRHRVRSWYVASMMYVNRDLYAGFARREIDVIPPEARLSDFLQRERAMQQELSASPDLYAHTLAFDPERWEIMRFSLWKDALSADKPASDSVIEYDVLHVSEPDSFS
jgi:hypothetical protein